MRVLARALGVVGSFVVGALPASVAVSLAACAILAPSPKVTPAHLARVSPPEPSTHAMPSGAEPGAPKEELPSPPSPRDDGRLPNTAVPQGYSLKLTVDPHKPRFSGVTTIAIDVPAPTQYVVLHGRGLHVTRAVAQPANATTTATGGPETSAGAAKFTATATTRMAHGGVEPDELVLAFDQALPAGHADLEITYDAAFAPDLAGLYRVTEDGRDYAFTQFESTDARRAFPCFDEPGFKTRYDVTLITPRGMTALANTAEAKAQDVAGGLVAHTFQTTVPLPSYLLAFAVGEFDIVSGQTSPVPIRVVTTKGRGELGKAALEVTSALLARLTDYFGIDYPYPKLDLVAVPDFDAGAMENPGLITFRDTFLLLDPRRTTTAARRGQAEVIAHELAHQWFGDLVTIKWWNDIWLNEGFATWAEGKAVDLWRPAFGATMEQVAGLEHVMDADALASARAVRQPVRSTGEAMEAFDEITYEKGAAVLRMLEGWLGADMFQRGIHRYLRENAWKTASADDLFKALEYVSTQKIGELARGFLEQSGVPEVSLGWTCKADGAKLELRESEWKPLGEPPSAVPREWTLPVCLTGEGSKTKSCFTLGQEPIVRALGPTCPQWVYPNAELAGYYRFVLDRPKLLALARAAHSLDATDRLGLLTNAWAAVREGTLAPGVLLDMLPTFDSETDRYVQGQVIDILRSMDHALVADEARPAFRRFVVARLSAQKRALGWESESPRAEDDEHKLERSRVLSALGDLAGDETTLDEADTFATRWLSDPTSVSNDVAAIAVPLASIRQGAARLVELRAAARSAKLPQDRVLAIRSMGMFDDPVVLRAAFDLTLTGEIKLSELNYVLGPAAGRRAGRATLYAWEKDNWAELRKRFPGSLTRGLVSAASSACGAAERDDAKAFFTNAMKDVEGAQRPLDEAIERADLCTALRDHGAADVTAWLAAWQKHHSG
ncbi:MAG TPA: M1 family metallopeptidase [Polyangiaceae bacterium]|jgi:alanyl aminopeptidase|nr:M1 family metallopeptidase [Polyangiaceae bacterium]